MTERNLLEGSSRFPDTRQAGSREPVPSAAELPTRSGNFLGAMVGRSPAMHKLFRQMRWVAPHLRVAMVVGEEGTGKSLTAQTLHLLGAATRFPFVACPAETYLSSSEPESIFPMGRGGMLYLDRIETLTAEQQHRLIALVNTVEGAVAQPEQLVLSSAVPLQRLLQSGKFFAELGYRLSGMHFTLPPLRERREDIPLLAQIFLERFSRKYGRQIRGLGPGALGPLVRHGWPGNVRQLRAVLHAALLSAEGQWVRPIDLPPLDTAARPQPSERASTNQVPAEAAPEVAEDLSLDTAIRRHIREVLQRTQGNKLRAARLLRISRSTLYRILGDPRKPLV